MNDKELLICLVMEKLSSKIFGEKINIDFGMVHVLADHSEQIIE